MKKKFAALLLAIFATLALANPTTVPAAGAGTTTNVAAAAKQQDWGVLEIVAHRGTGPGNVRHGGRLFSENTIPAFNWAVNTGAQTVEYDLQKTENGKFIVSHDPTVQRMTNGYGLIHDHGIKWARQWRTPSRQRMPSLWTLLHATQGRRAIMHQQELKPAGFTFEDLQVIDKLNDRFIGDPTRVVFTSRSPRQLCQIKKIDPLYRTGLIHTGGKRFAINKLDPSCIDMVNYVFWRLDGNYVTWAHSRGIDVTARTVNNVGDYRKMRMIGADRIVTDKPALIAAANRSR